MNNKPLRIKCLSFLAGLPFLVYLVRLIIFFAQEGKGFGNDEYWVWAGQQIRYWMTFLGPLGGIGLVLSRGLYGQKNWARIMAIIMLGIWGTWFALDFYRFAHPGFLTLMAGAQETYQAQRREALLFAGLLFVVPMIGGIWFLSTPSTRKLFQ